MGQFIINTGKDMKKVVLSSMILMLLMVGCSQKPLWFEGTFDDAKALAANEGKLVLVDFYSPG